MNLFTSGISGIPKKIRHSFLSINKFIKIDKKHSKNIWGKFDGEIKASGTLTIQEQGIASGDIEYQNLQIKLGGQISGDIKKSDKIQPIKKDSKPSEENNSLQEAIKKD